MAIKHLLPTYDTPISDAVKALENEVARMRDLCFVAGQEVEQLRAFRDSVPWAAIYALLNPTRGAASVIGAFVVSDWHKANAPKEPTK